MKLLSIIGIVVVLLTVSLPAHAAPQQGLITVKTAVYSITRSGDTCTIYLRNGSALYGAWGDDCRARRGQGVVLNYSEYVTESVTCDWRGRCKPVMVKTRSLDNWYIVR